MVTSTSAATAQKGSKDRPSSSTRSQNKLLQPSALAPSRASSIQGRRERGLGGISGSNPVPPPSGILLLDSREVSRLLGIGRTKAFEMMARAELPVVRIGRCVRVPHEALAAWIRDKTVEIDRFESLRR